MTDSMFGSRRRRAKIPPVEYDDHGRKKCRVCGQLVTGRGVYCGSKCRDQFLIARRPEYAAMRLRQEKGHQCANCGADEIDCFERYRQAMELLAGTPCEGLLAPFVMFQADHERPVSDRGGECGLENLRLLCDPCHGGVTHALMVERKSRKKASGPWGAVASAARKYKRPLPGRSA